MKKFTFLMSLLLAFGATTSSAQILDRSGWRVTTSGECNDGNSGHAASIIDGNINSYWHSNWGGGNASGDTSKQLPQFFQLDLGSEQEFNKIGYMPRGGLDNGTVTAYKIYVSNTPFKNVSSDKNAAAIVNELGTPQMTGTFSYNGVSEFKTETSRDMLRGRYVLFVVTDAIKKSDKDNQYASCAEFYLSKDVELTMRNITYHFKVGEVEYGSKTFEDVVDETKITVPTMNFLANGTITPTADGYNIACTQKALPFVAQSSFDATNAHWYAITLRGNENNYLLTDGGGESVSTTAVSTTNHPEVLEDAYQWAFVGNLKDGFKLYSKRQNKPVTLSGHLKLIDGEGTTFKLKELASGDGFGMFENETAGCINQDKNANNVAPWSGFDDGSTLRLQEPKIYVINYAKPFFSTGNGSAPENAIWSTPSVDKEAYRTVYEAAIAENAANEQFTALAAKNKEMSTATFSNSIEVGKYYRLYNVSDSRKWLTVNSDNNSILTCSADAEKGIGSVVTFEAISSEAGQYRMKFEGKTLGKYKKDNAAIELVDDNSEEKGSYTVNAIGNNFTFYDKASNKAHSYIHCNTNNLVGWEVSAPSKWYVVPATDVEVAMKAVGDKSYATAYLPFGVSAISGAEAYVGALNDTKDQLNMTEVKTIPANKGVVLVGTADATKATLTISNLNEALTIANDLVGTNTKVAVTDATRANYLVFGKNKENAAEVGFFKPSAKVTSIPANKAYLEASKLTAGAIAMNFGGNTTGVNTVVLGENGVNAPVFDLSGRRVVAPVKGGVYIQNGKKFIK